VKIAIFGSTGTTGKELIKQALNLGFFVTAYARKPQKLSELANDNLIIVQGELDDKNIIAKVINDTDVVIS